MQLSTVDSNFIKYINVLSTGNSKFNKCVTYWRYMKTKKYFYLLKIAKLNVLSTKDSNLINVYLLKIAISYGKMYLLRLATLIFHLLNLANEINILSTEDNKFDNLSAEDKKFVIY